MIEVQEPVRARARATGNEAWLKALPALVDELERAWQVRAVRSLSGGTEAFVAEVARDGGAAVLKIHMPGEPESVRNEVAVLQLAGGEGCARLYESDADRGALLLEKLGPSLFDLGLPVDRRSEILCDAAARMWRPAPDAGLPTGAWKGQWLEDWIARGWEELGRPCEARTIEHALGCARRRIDAHDDERAVLVHGDVHQWNTLEAEGGFKLIDPDGLLAEPAYDLGVVIREDADVVRGAAVRERANLLAARAGIDAEPVWEWGVVERVSTGLAATQIDLQPEARAMLSLADELSVAETAK